ncbi:MAG TPA: hypothetical protein V6D06_17295 [Trichocoleus sp.]
MNHSTPDETPDEQILEERIQKMLEEQRRQRPKSRFKSVKEGKITQKIQEAMPELTLEEARRRGLWLLLQSLEHGWDEGSLDSSKS